MLLSALAYLCSGDMNRAEAWLWFLLSIELAIIEYSIDRVYEKLEGKKQ
jgi:hypothetical protein